MIFVASSKRKEKQVSTFKNGTLDAPCKVQIAAQGILTERVKQGPAGTRSLSFKTKLFAPLGKAGNGPELGECVENDKLHQIFRKRCQGQGGSRLPFCLYLLLKMYFESS